MPREPITLSADEYEALMDTEAMLQCLYYYEVYKWPGFSNAKAKFLKEKFHYYNEEEGS